MEFNVVSFILSYFMILNQIEFFVRCTINENFSKNASERTIATIQTEIERSSSKSSTDSSTSGGNKDSSTTNSYYISSSPLSFLSSENYNLIGSNDSVEQQQEDIEIAHVGVEFSSPLLSLTDSLSFNTIEFYTNDSISSDEFMTNITSEFSSSINSNKWHNILNISREYQSQQQKEYFLINDITEEFPKSKRQTTKQISHLKTSKESTTEKPLSFHTTTFELPSLSSSSSTSSSLPPSSLLASQIVTATETNAHKGALVSKFNDVINVTQQQQQQQKFAIIQNLIDVATSALTSLTSTTTATTSALTFEALSSSLSSSAEVKVNTSSVWPVKHASIVEGDVVLGGLMMVHSREDSITCGPIMPQGGIQAMEAMLYTLDRINENQLLPNITLGAHILDDCDKDTYGLEMAVDFIKENNEKRLRRQRHHLKRHKRRNHHYHKHHQQHQHQQQESKNFHNNKNTGDDDVNMQEGYVLSLESEYTNHNRNKERYKNFTTSKDNHNNYNNYNQKRYNFSLQERGQQQEIKNSIKNKSLTESNYDDDDDDDDGNMNLNRYGRMEGWLINNETIIETMASATVSSEGAMIDSYFIYPGIESINTSSSRSGGRSTKVFRSIPIDTYDDLLDQQQLQLQQQQHNHHWPVKREAVVEGDLILGGLMMVHSREDSIICGPIMPQGGIQALEAMLYTLDRINKIKLLPNITLGAHILDDCDKDSYGLEMAVDFIKGSISNIDDAEYHCNKTTVRKVISGVVGAASSVTSIQVANLLRLFRIPQVSFFSTSPELSNKQRFEYFSRTIPSDHYQVKAMVEIVKRMGWSYISIIYEESNYGIKAYEELEELLAKHNICIAVKEKLVKDSGVAEEIAYDNIVQKLLTKPRARGCIIFGSDQEVAGVMRAVRRSNATGAFSWIGSDGWSARNLVSDGNEPEVEGTLSVQPQANPVKGFEAYFLNLTVENNQRNPWFVEFWEDHFQCRYPNSSATPYNIKYTRVCTKNEKLTKNNTDFEDQLQFVSDAVMAFAYALRDMHRDLCGGLPTLCDSMKPTKGADLLKYLRKVEFEGLSGDHFRFDANGDGPARYNIIHFKQTEYGKYRWIKVGEYYEGELRLNMSEVQFKLHHPKPPESVCSLPCERGQAKKYVEGESCCWHCFNCSLYQIRHPDDETQCLTCRKGTLPDRMKEFCQDIPEVYLRPESGWAIGAMAFSSTGILITLFVVGVFFKHNDTPVVRASGRELSYILLAGILMCYLVTFALVLRPTDIVCGIQRFGAGFCFTVVYAALLTKTNRISRIFKAGKQSAKRPSFISPKSQLVICACLIFVQILINGVWMVISPAHAIHHYPTREDNLLVCDSYIDASYMIAFFYPIILIIICTVYAVLTRKIPEAFNESKHIGFTMYTTCVIWLAFVPLYFGTANHVSLRITSMSVTISLSASVTVACLFSPKLYIILIRPERNVRQSMMPARYSAMNRNTTGTGPSSMMAAVMVTAATCNQDEKMHKHISPSQTQTENGRIKLCEMATQTVNISNIFTNLDSNTLYPSIKSSLTTSSSSAPINTQLTTSTGTVETSNYGIIPYVDQNVPNNIENNQLANNYKINNNNSNNQSSSITTITTTVAAISQQINATSAQKSNVSPKNNVNANSVRFCTPPSTPNIINSDKNVGDSDNDGAETIRQRQHINLSSDKNHVIDTSL